MCFKAEYVPLSDLLTPRICRLGCSGVIACVRTDMDVRPVYTLNPGKRRWAFVGTFRRSWWGSCGSLHSVRLSHLTSSLKASGLIDMIDDFHLTSRQLRPIDVGHRLLAI